jgi:hypothetical protein
MSVYCAEDCAVVCDVSTACDRWRCCVQCEPAGVTAASGVVLPLLPKLWEDSKEQNVLRVPIIAVVRKVRVVYPQLSRCTTH